MGFGNEFQWHSTGKGRRHSVMRERWMMVVDIGAAGKDDIWSRQAR